MIHVRMRVSTTRSGLQPYVCIGEGRGLVAMSDEEMTSWPWLQCLGELCSLTHGSTPKSARECALQCMSCSVVHSRAA